ncbi:MAG: transposase [Halapricum sp.]
MRAETNLTADLVQKGIRRAIEAVDSGVEKLKKGEKTSQPHFESWSVVYDKRSATFNDDHDQNGVVLRVDLNVTGAFAVTSTGAFIGSADYLNHKRDQYEQRRGRLQQTGTRSVHLTIKSISSKFADWSLDWLHNRANELIEEAHIADVDGIIFEDLTHIRENIANGSQFQQWAYKKFVELVEYKVESTVLFVDFVNPAYTSRS